MPCGLSKVRHAAWGWRLRPEPKHESIKATMAKKQTAKATEAPEKPQAAPASEEKAAAKKEQKKAREPKAKTAPAAPAAEAAAAKAPAAAPTPAPAAAGAGAGPTKKRGKQPGNPPSLGKKLKSHMLNVKQRLDKEGPMPVKRAIELLKQLKRAKFDETV